MRRSRLGFGVGFVLVLMGVGTLVDVLGRVLGRAHFRVAFGVVFRKEKSAPFSPSKRVPSTKQPNGCVLKYGPPKQNMVGFPLVSL